MKPILNPFAPEHRALLGEVLRFVAVGITAVALQYGVYALMLLVVNAFIANTIGYGVSFLFKHALHLQSEAFGAQGRGVRPLPCGQLWPATAHPPHCYRPRYDTHARSFADVCHHRSPEFRARAACVKMLKQRGIAQMQGNFVGFLAVKDLEYWNINAIFAT